MDEGRAGQEIERMRSVSFICGEDAIFADVERKRRKRNAVLFSRDSECLRELKRLIERQTHRVLVLWALDCARAPLARFEEKYPNEFRPRTALEKSEAWARGEIKMPIAKRAILDAHAVAKEIDDKIYGALCHAIGHAGATVHVETHALGLPFYELTALALEHAKSGYQERVRAKIDYYSRRLVHWQENAFKLDLEWASFLTDDNRPNQEKRLNEKRGQDPSAKASSPDIP